MASSLRPRLVRRRLLGLLLRAQGRLGHQAVEVLDALHEVRGDLWLLEERVQARDVPLDADGALEPARLLGHHRVILRAPANLGRHPLLGRGAERRLGAVRWGWRSSALE